MRRSIEFAALVSIVSLLGCAGSRVTKSVEEEPRPLAKPSTLLVYDFAVTADDLVGDALGADFDPPPPSDRDHAMARLLTDDIVAKLGEKGIAASRAETSSVVPEDALLLQGQFVTIKEGSRAARMAIGFGAGRRELRVLAQMYQWTGAELRRIQHAEAQAHGDRMPGMAAPMAVGAVVSGGVLLPILISGSMNVGQEITGDLRRTIGRLAAAIADNTANFYRARGWL
jgi:hypothetical protein